jgi:hypothetical protein
MKSLVAVCDILGFSDYVCCPNIEPSLVAKKCLGFVRQIIKLVLGNENMVSEVPSLTEISNNSGIGIACFSDTFLIYTKQDTNDNCRLLCNVLSASILFGLTQFHTKMRCGVAYGEVHIEEANSVFIGKPIVEAHLLERSQLWSGGAYAKSAEERIGFFAGVDTNQPFADWKIVSYKVPLKPDAKAESNLAVDWTLSTHSPDIIRWSKGHLTPTENDWKTREHICRKWDNTKKFHDQVCRFHHSL